MFETGSNRRVLDEEKRHDHTAVRSPALKLIGQIGNASSYIFRDGISGNRVTSRLRIAISVMGTLRRTAITEVRMWLNWRIAP